MRTNYFFVGSLKVAAGMVLALLLVLLGVAPPAVAQTTNPLQFYKNYFVTGDYAAKGVGVRNTGQLDPATGRRLAVNEITIPNCTGNPNTDKGECVPADAKIFGAFFYWMTLEKTGVPSGEKGYALNPATVGGPAPQLINCSIDGGNRCVMLGKPVGPSQTAQCWSNGGSTGNNNGAPSMQVYRADVLRFLPTVGGNKIARLKFWVPDNGGNGNGVPLTEGGSLVVLYTKSSLPFKGIVIFDGMFAMNRSTDGLLQTIDGFYQAATNGAPPYSAKITHIAGDGQNNFPEQLWFGTSSATNPLGPSTGPFVGSSGDAWDNLTYDVTPFVTNGTGSVQTKVDHGQGSFDCIAWSAIVFSTPVLDSDADGLVDLWEQPGGGYQDRTRNGWASQVIPLYSMGARVGQQDLFVEVDHQVRYKADGTVDHTEQPTAEVLNMVGAALTKPPQANRKIHVHFDAGPNIAPSEFIIAAGAGPLEGGDAANEKNKAFYCGEVANTDTCAFPGQPGLVRWLKTILEVQHSYVPKSDPKYLPGDPNYVKGTAQNSRLYFSEARSHVFHHVFAVHQLAMRDPNDTGFANGQFVGYRARTVSGRSNLPGRSLVLATGGWKSITPTGRAGTLLHELAHSLSVTHQGTANGLNCNPNRQGVVNYANQLGFYDAAGKLVIGLSNQVLKGQSNYEDESLLQEAQSLTADGNTNGTTEYRLRWYAPAQNVAQYLGLDKLNPPAQLVAPKRHCDGSATTNSDANVIRVDRVTLGQVSAVSLSNIDWNYNRLIDTAPGDINFNGKSGNNGEKTAAFDGSNDFQDIIDRRGLQQIDVSPNVFGLSRGVLYRDLLNPNESELGTDEIGTDEIGTDEIGTDEIGTDEIGTDEIGTDEIGTDEIGTDEIGTDEIGEVDETQATLSGGNAATINTIQVVGNGNNAGVLLTWTPGGGNVVSYTIVRSETINRNSDTVSTNPPTIIGPLAPNVNSLPGQPVPNYVDFGAANNTRYRYIILTTFQDPATGQTSGSGPSDPAFITR